MQFPRLVFWNLIRIKRTDSWRCVFAGSNAASWEWSQINWNLIHHCVLTSLCFSKKYIKKLLFHEGKLDSLVNSWQWLCQGLGKARVLMEHLEAGRRHISIHCCSDCVFSTKRRGTKTDNSQHRLTFEWRKLFSQYKISNKPLRAIQYMACDSFHYMSQEIYG